LRAVGAEPLGTLGPEELAERVPGLSLAEARRISALACRHGSLPPVTPAGLRRELYLRVRAEFPTPELELVAEQPSALDPFIKYSFAAPDGAPVETVRIPLERPGRAVVCVSSQVGCALGCVFCGTARLGWRRNLDAWEIVEQVRQVRARLPRGTRVHGVVFQGMGEPLLNLGAVLRAARVLSEPSGLAIDARNVTICTAGIARALPRLLAELPRVRLALSIGSARPETRAALMPIERSQPLASSLELLGDHARRTGIAPVLSYTLIGGKNDAEPDLSAFVRMVQDFVGRVGVRPRVSLVSYNRLGPDDPLEPARPERMEEFRQAIGELGVPVVRRYSGGADVGAACGQLGLGLAGRGPGGMRIARAGG
jgi:23S rRNA (adenine2503-C2)-methyltransferase